MENEAEVQEKTAPTAEQRAMRKAARLIGRVVWHQAYKASNPEATNKEIREAAAASGDNHAKTGKQVLKALEKSGLTVSLAASKEAEDA